MADRSTPAVKVPDLAGHLTGVGDTIAAALTFFGDPVMRLGKVVDVIERTPGTVDGAQHRKTLLLVRWHLASEHAPLPGAPTRIDAAGRRFVNVNLHLPDPPTPTEPVDAPHVMTLEEMAGDA